MTMTMIMTMTMTFLKFPTFADETTIHATLTSNTTYIYRHKNKSKKQEARSKPEMLNSSMTCLPKRFQPPVVVR
jgi:hypothetical protein